MVLLGVLYECPVVLVELEIDSLDVSLVASAVLVHAALVEVVVL